MFNFALKSSASYECFLSFSAERTAVVFIPNKYYPNYTKYRENKVRCEKQREEEKKNMQGGALLCDGTLGRKGRMHPGMEAKRKTSQSPNIH